MWWVMHYVHTAAATVSHVYEDEVMNVRGDDRLCEGGPVNLFIQLAAVHSVLAADKGGGRESKGMGMIA